MHYTLLIEILRYLEIGAFEYIQIAACKRAQQLPTTSNNMQQGVQTDATCQHPAMLGVVGQQCCVRLHGA